MHTDVTFDRREADPQGSRHLAFAHAPADGLDYLSSEVFGVGFHPSMVPDGPVPLQTALGDEQNFYRPFGPCALAPASSRVCKMEGGKTEDGKTGGAE